MRLLEDMKAKSFQQFMKDCPNRKNTKGIEMHIKVGRNEKILFPISEQLKVLMLLF